jgi:integrase
VKESTYAHYVFVCEKHLLPYFKGCKANRLNTDVLNQFVTFKLERGGVKGTPLSAKTVSDIVCILTHILKKQCNLSFDIDKPGIKQPEIFVLSDKDYERMLSSLFIGTDTKSLGLMIAMLTGLRLGELCALQWQDFDFDNEVIYITKTLQRLKVTDKSDNRKTKIIINAPKSEASIRLVPIPSVLIAKLKEFKHYDKTYVLTGTMKHMEPRNYQTYFKKILKKFHLQDNKFHILRHTFATRAIAKGMDLKTLSVILGHTDVSFTMKMYVHPTLEQKKAQIEKVAVNF